MISCFLFPSAFVYDWRIGIFLLENEALLLKEKKQMMENDGHNEN